MLDYIKGCMVGAAIGDALGMAGESMPMDISHRSIEYRRAWRGHPNARLSPGQYTDDTQMMLLVGNLLAEGKYSNERYADELAAAYDRDELRFPDGSVASACEHIFEKGHEGSGINSNTTGCISIALPFAVICHDQVEMSEHLVMACAVTHTNPSAHAASVTFAYLINSALQGQPNALDIAVSIAEQEDTLLGNKIKESIRLEREGISLESALHVIGNDVTVFQTLPLSFFLMSRFEDISDLLSIAANIGGNTDTIAFICGAYAGAREGVDAFPEPLRENLENYLRIVQLAERLYGIFSKKA